MRPHGPAAPDPQHGAVHQSQGSLAGPHPARPPRPEDPTPPPPPAPPAAVTQPSPRSAPAVEPKPDAASKPSVPTRSAGGFSVGTTASLGTSPTDPGGASAPGTGVVVELAGRTPKPVATSKAVRRVAMAYENNEPTQGSQGKGTSAEEEVPIGGRLAARCSASHESRWTGAPSPRSPQESRPNRYSRRKRLLYCGCPA